MARQLERCRYCGRIVPMQKHHVARESNSAEFLTDACDECHQRYFTSIHSFDGDSLSAMLFGTLQCCEVMYQRTGWTDAHEAFNQLAESAKRHLGYERPRTGRKSFRKPPAIRDSERLEEIHDISTLYRDLIKSLRKEWPGLEAGLLIRFYDTCANDPLSYLQWTLSREAVDLTATFNEAFRPDRPPAIPASVLEVIINDAAAFMSWRRTVKTSSPEMIYT